MSGIHKMLDNQKIIFWGFGLILALFVTSYIASLIFFIMSGYDMNMAKPWSIWEYASLLSDNKIQSRFLVSLAIPHIALIAGLIKLFEPEETAFGDARWATFSDIKKSGMFKKTGVILGKYKNKYLISDDPKHILCVAPTRSGKGVGLVVPNLLNWSDSIICLDVKHENYGKTAGYRKAHGQEVFMWSPQDKNSHCYNPLDALSSDPHRRIGDLKIIGKILVQDPQHGDDFWASEARSLFVGLALYVLDKPDMPSTIGSIYRLLGTEADLGDVCRHIVKNHSELPVAGKKTLSSFANKAAKERSGVKSNLDKALEQWDTPSVDAATSRSDFSITDLRKKKISIYVGVRPGEIKNLAPLIRIFFEQVISLLSMEEPDKAKEPYNVLMIMDEFHMLGKMSAMESAFTLLAGYNCRVMAVVQGLEWIDEAYNLKIRNGILSCCAHQIFFAANDLETARYVSDSCGEKTVKAHSTTHKGAALFETPSRNISFRARPLITKEKVKQLPKDEQIIIVENGRPVKAKKIEYFNDKQLRNREIPPPPIPELNITDTAIPEFKIPTQNESKEPYIDPNQEDMFASENTCLTESLNEPSNDALEDEDVDENSYILKKSSQVK